MWSNSTYIYIFYYLGERGLPKSIQIWEMDVSYDGGRGRSYSYNLCIQKIKKIRNIFELGGRLYILYSSHFVKSLVSVKGRNRLDKAKKSSKGFILVFELWKNHILVWFNGKLEVPTVVQLVLFGVGYICSMLSLYLCR